MTSRSHAMNGLARSLLVKRQRALLDSLGAQVGTPVVYLKSAWADPVLYGGRGERGGSDIDVLIEPALRGDFMEALETHGFRAEPMLEHHTLRGRAMRAPTGWLDVDVHRAIGERPWFPLDEAGLLKRSMRWASVDGPILGLCAEDQVVHAAAHYSGDRFLLDGRHLGDIERLIERGELDWTVVTHTCAEGHLTIGLHVLAAMLRARRVTVPAIALGPFEQLRLSALRALFNVGGNRRVWTASYKTNIRLELLTFLPLLSTRLTALPRFVAGAVSARVS